VNGNASSEKVVMIEVGPFHSKNHLSVYHASSRCRIGKKIHPRNRAFGTGGLRLCLRCEKLLAQERSQAQPVKDLG
jgi:hypothetical protein